MDSGTLADKGHAGWRIALFRATMSVYGRTIGPLVRKAFFIELIDRTRNFGDTTWHGRPTWQNVLDAWVIQEAIFEVKPSLIIECGTNRGGSALFYGDLLDLIGHGQVVSVDIERMHTYTHPRVTFLVGSSTSPEIADQLRGAAAKATGPVLVILDSDHSRDHVARELELYAPLATVGSYVLVQDGVIDTLPVFQRYRPGPVPAIRRFLESHPEFVADDRKNNRFLITHHPLGWLRRVR